MTSHLETAIRDAIGKGGYKNVIKAVKRTKYPFGLNESSVLLDADFWRELGKARGWGVFDDGSPMPKDVADKIAMDKNINLIQHLHAGGDAETFFASL